MATKRIVINLQDNITDALVKSQNKRLAVLETMLKTKKTKKKDALTELARLNSMKKTITSNEIKLKNVQSKNNVLVNAFKKVASGLSSVGSRVQPSPS